MAFFSEIDAVLQPSQLDAAGSLPVSQRIITGNYLQTRDELPLLFDRAGTGTQTYSDGHVDMSVTAGQYALCQSKSFSPYLPGKPTSIKLTFFDFDQQANVSKRVGFGSRSTVAPYTADFDGFYFEADGTTYNLHIANSATGASTTTVQSSWDDPLDGTGESGITANFENFTVLEFDFLFLGGTALRCFINVGGDRILFHTFKWSNDNTDTIFRNPAQPVFYEIRSTTGTGSLAQVCASTEVQGSLDLVGIPFSVNNAVTHINANSTANNYLLNAIQLKSANRGAFIQVQTITALATTNDNFLYSLILDPTYSSAPTFNAVTDSAIEHAVGAGITVTNGTILASGYAANRSTFLQEVDSSIRLGTQIDGTRTSIALCARPLSSNLDILGSLNIIQV
jgi:hypothetical protein